MSWSLLVKSMDANPEDTENQNVTHQWFHSPKDRPWDFSSFNSNRNSKRMDISRL